MKIEATCILDVTAYNSPEMVIVTWKLRANDSVWKLVSLSVSHCYTFRQYMPWSQFTEGAHHEMSGLLIPELSITQFLQSCKMNMTSHHPPLPPHLQAYRNLPYLADETFQVKYNEALLETLWKG